MMYHELWSTTNSILGPCSWTRTDKRSLRRWDSGPWVPCICIIPHERGFDFRILLHQISLELFHHYLVFSPQSMEGRSERQRENRFFTLCSFLFLIFLPSSYPCHSLSQGENRNSMNNACECMKAGIGVRKQIWLYSILEDPLDRNITEINWHIDGQLLDPTMLLSVTNLVTFCVKMGLPVPRTLVPLKFWGWGKPCW